MNSVVAAFREACAEHSQRDALESTAETLTYQELDAVTDRIAGGLTKAGVGPGRHVAIFAGRSPQFVMAALGVLKCGAVYVPIDPEYPVERQRAILKALTRPIAIGDRSLEGVGPAGSVGVQVLDIDQLRTSTAPAPTGSVGAEAAAYVMFTSGSTGVPKGSVIAHRGIVRLVCGADYAEFGPSHRWALLSSVAFDASTLEIWGPLLNGGTCVVLEDRLASLDRIAEFFRGGRVSDTWMTAALFNSMVDYRVDAFAKMKQVFSGGETESARHFKRFIESCPGVRLIHGYGPTENTTFSLCHTVRAEDVYDGGRVPIGRAIRGTSVRIVDGERCEVADGSVGELLVGGAGVGLGYLDQPELTSERFVTLDGEGCWYRTGDLVRRRADGLVEFLGRVDRQVKVRGFRIEPEEIEKTLTACPGVTAAVVEAVGEDAETRHLVAHCATGISRAGEISLAGEINRAGGGGRGGPDEQEIRDFLAQRLPPHMLPTDIRVYTELPLTTTGKIDRRKLGGAVGGALEQPLGLEEQALAQIWQKLLPGVPIGRETDFFAAGGHSVLVLKMVAEVRRGTGIVLSPSAVYQSRTLSRVAAAAAGVPRAEVPVGPGTLAPATAPQAEEGTDGSPCGSMQRSLYYEWHLDPSGSGYHVHAGFVAEPGFDAESLKARFLMAMARHDALRMRCVMTEKGLRQRLCEVPPPELVVRDEGVAAWGGPGEAFPASVLERIHAPFDIESGPPVRLHLFRLRDERWLVVVSLHHSTVDEWSLDLLVSELEDRAAMEGGPAPGASIVRYVEWERAHVNIDEARRRGGEMARCVEAGYPLVVTGRGMAVTAVRQFRPELALRVRQFARREGVTQFVVLLAAYGLFLRRRYGLDEPWVLTPFANRSDPCLAEIIGCCIDLRLLRVRCGEQSTFTDLVRRTSETVFAEHDLGPVPLEEVSAGFRQVSSADFAAAMQFVMTYRVDPHRTRTLGGVAAQPIRVPAAGSKFGLLMQFEQQGEALACVAESAVEALSEQELSRLLGEFETMLGEALTSPRAAVGALPATRVAAMAIDVSRPAEAVPSPQHELDAACAAAWCRVLKRERADASDDFFRSGGTSLLALRLTAEVRRDTGVTPAVGLFVAHPTLATLCALVRSGGGEAPLVSRFGDPASDAVIFAIPGLGNSAVVYHKLWMELRHMMPSPPLVVAADFHRVTDLALAKGGLRPAIDELVAACIEIAGNRPVGLAGYSLGGLLVPEMARALTARGHAAAHVWLLDPYAAKFAWPEPARQALDTALRFARMPWRLPIRVLERLRRRSVGAGEGGKPEAQETHGNKQSNRLLRDAFRAHSFVAYDGPVTFIRSSYSTAHAGAALADRWHGMKPYLSGPCRMVDLKIAHVDFLRSGTGQVAGVMAEELRVARQTRSGRVGGGP